MKKSNQLLFIATFLVSLYSVILQGGSKMQLKSAVFNNGGEIPRIYTCDGRNINPPLSWENIPSGTESFALIIDDPDAPKGTFVHWVLYNLPATMNSLEENVSRDFLKKRGAFEGMNSAREQKYMGPCPPSGTHHYHFKLYALDTKLIAEAGFTKDELLKKMEGHMVAKAELVGTYARSAKK